MKIIMSLIILSIISISCSDLGETPESRRAQELQDEFDRLADEIEENRQEAERERTRREQEKTKAETEKVLDKIKDLKDLREEMDRRRDLFGKRERIRVLDKNYLGSGKIQLQVSVIDTSSEDLVTYQGVIDGKEDAEDQTYSLDGFSDNAEVPLVFTQKTINDTIYFFATHYPFDGPRGDLYIFTEGSLKSVMVGSDFRPEILNLVHRATGYSTTVLIERLMDWMENNPTLVEARDFKAFGYEYLDIEGKSELDSL